MHDKARRRRSRRPPASEVRGLSLQRLTERPSESEVGPGAPGGVQGSKRVSWSAKTRRVRQSARGLAIAIFTSRLLMFCGF